MIKTHNFAAFTPLTPVDREWGGTPLVIFVFRQLVNDKAASVGLNLGDQTSPRSFIPPVPQDGRQNHTKFMMEAASMLVCDPHPRVYTAEVMFGELPYPLLTATEVLPYPTMGNLVAQGFKSELFFNLFRDPLLFPDTLLRKSSPLFTSLTRLLFLCKWNDPCKGDLNPLPLVQIAQNMNRFLVSGMKAYLDGYNGTLPRIADTYGGIF